MFSNSGFIICTIVYVCIHIDGEEVDLIAALDNVPKRIQHQKSCNQRKQIWNLNVTDDKRRDLLLTSTKSKEILHLLIKKQNFGICVNLKQDQTRFGTIFSITHKNNVRLLDISISLSKKAVRLVYSPDWAFRGLTKKKFEYSLSKSQWHSLCFEYSVHDRRFSVKSDCYNYVSKNLQFRLPKSKFQNKNLDEFQVWIGQRNSKNGYFKGVLKQMLFSTKSSYSLDFCATLIENAIITPTNFLMNTESITNRLNMLEKEVSNLKLKLHESNNKLNDIEKCQCFPLCTSSTGEKKAFTETWQENSCRNCTCTHHGKKCDEEKCPDLICDHKVVDPGKCCQRCGNTCRYQGKTYNHKGNFTINCLKCHCHDGSLSCRRMNPKSECPPLSCNRFLQVKIPGKCCKQCKKINLCDFSNCGTNAFCTASSTMFKCQCKLGFHGNPYRNCEDTNECQNPLNCPASTECINTEGSFTCVCKPGYIRLNSSVLSCTATCAKNECKNNSSCVAPDKCECAVGFTGPQCDIDIDECKLGLIKCPVNSECLNIPGSYVCRCVNGYRSNKNGTMSVYYDHQCKDIDECSGTRGIHYICDIHSTCVNIPGGYECISNIKLQEEKNCRIENLKNGVEVIEDGKEITCFETCMKCKCVNRKIICLSIQCTCAVVLPKSCCRNCYPNECNSAMSMSIRNSEFQGFSCMLNTSSCPNKECPKVYCHDSIILFGQCCKFCRSDHITSCMLEYNYSVNSLAIYNDYSSVCFYNGTRYENGEKFIFQNHLDGSCIKCLCWNQYFCCARSFSCRI